jgi:hypothetical protein
MNLNQVIRTQNFTDTKQEGQLLGCDVGSEANGRSVSQEI